MMNTFQYDFSELGVDGERIGRLLGCGEGYQAADFSGLILELIGNIAPVCSAKAGYSIYPVEEWKNAAKSATIHGIDFNLRDVVFSQVRKAESLALFICTAGPEPEKLCKKAMEDGDPLASYIYDIIGSEIAELASRLVLKEVRKASEISGLRVTNRYSPGYCGWDVSEQHKLFELMPGNSCGVSLNASALMNPEKSVSGLIGIGAEVSFDAYPCNLCRRTDCLYRMTQERANTT
ncbi:MAG: hypothetical protein JXR67_08555 [Bacteroidales bacterium]|nr:hypothetical protein [Bacteroidales bacterium]